MASTASEPKVRKIDHHFVDMKVVRENSGPRLRPWMTVAIGELLLCAAILTVAYFNPVWWVWIPCGFLIGTRQHALSILTHDGAHFMIHKKRPLNDTLGNWLSAYPLMMSVEGYRGDHLKHHWTLERPEDPGRISLDHHPKDWIFPMTKRYYAWMIVRDLTGLSLTSAYTLLEYLWHIPHKHLHMAKIALLHVTMLLVAAAVGNAWLYLLLWAVPLFTVTPMCYRVRSTAEHSGMVPHSERYAQEVVDVIPSTRTTLPNPLMRFLFVPHNVSLHIEHHLYPSVSFSALPALHEQLMKNPEYLEKANITRGHVALLNELTDMSKAEAAA